MAILGLDCSSNNGLVDWALARERGVQFAFYRKNLRTWQDRLFAQNGPALLDSGIKPCLYTVWDARYPARPQVEAFVKDLWPAQWFRIAVDVELPHPWGVNSKRVLWDLTFVLDYIYEWHGRRPLIYTNAYYWNRYYSNRPGWDTYWDLWVANYQRAAPRLPVGWTDYTIWQYSADSNRLGPYYGGRSTSMDLNTAKDGFCA